MVLGRLGSELPGGPSLECLPVNPIEQVAGGDGEEEPIAQVRLLLSTRKFHGQSRPGSPTWSIHLTWGVTAEGLSPGLATQVAKATENVCLL